MPKIKTVKPYTRAELKRIDEVLAENNPHKTSIILEKEFHRDRRAIQQKIYSLKEKEEKKDKKNTLFSKELSIPIKGYEIKNGNLIVKF